MLRLVIAWSPIGDHYVLTVGGTVTAHSVEVSVLSFAMHVLAFLVLQCTVLGLTILNFMKDAPPAFVAQ